MDSKYTANNFKFILKFAKNLGTASFWLHPSDQAPPSNDFLPSRDSSGIEHVVSSANGGRSGAAQPTAAKQAQRIHHSARAILWVDTRSHFYYLRPLAEYSRNHMHPNACSKFHPRSANFKICRKMKNMKTFQKKNSRSQQIKNFRHGKTPIPQIQSCSFKFLQFNSTQIQPTTTQSSALPQYPAVHAGNNAVLLWWVHIQRCSDLKIGLHFVVEGKFMKIHGVFVFLFFRIMLNLFNSSEFISSNSHCK